MARQVFLHGTQFHEDGTEEIFLHGVQLSEDQAAAPAAGGLLSLTLTGVGSWLMWPLLLILNLRN